MTKDKAPESSEFEELSREQTPSLLREIWTFIREEKLWWMSPIIIALLLVGILVALTSTGAAPFIYTLF
jgi:membrane glycosyltransferase